MTLRRNIVIALFVVLVLVIGLPWLNTCDCKDGKVIYYTIDRGAGNPIGRVIFRAWTEGRDKNDGLRCVRSTHEISEYEFIHREHLGDSIHFESDPWP